MKTALNTLKLPAATIRDVRLCFLGKGVDFYASRETKTTPGLVIVVFP